MKKKRFTQVAAVGVVGSALVLLLAGAAMAGTKPQAPAAPADPYRAVQVTPASAIAAVRAMVERPLPQNAAANVGARAQVAAVQTSDLKANAPIDGKLLRFYDVEGADVSAIVDAHDGHVAQLLVMSRIPKVRTDATINDQQALDIASSYLADQGIAVDGMTAQVKLEDRGAALVYSVSWQRSVNGALVPDSRLVQLDAGTGVIFNVHNTSRPYSNPPTAVVARDQAISAAQDTATKSVGRKSATYKLIDASLQVTFDTQGTQGLVWQVKLYAADLANSTGYFEVTVDAMTGSASVTGRG